jgi:hypothetical protein
MPLLATEVVRRLPTAAALAAAVVATVVCFVIGWRVWLRPAVAWNGGGVTVRGVSGWVIARWPEVAHVVAEGEVVHVTTASGQTITVPAQVRRGGRTAESLRAGLEHARGRYDPSVEPPPLPRQASPWPLVALVPLPVAVLMAFQHWG